MHQLLKIFPLHPLTIEDILHQDTREKTETFDRLGYYLICFRGLDQSYFNLKDDDDDDDDADDDSDPEDEHLNSAGITSSRPSGSVRTRTINSSRDGIKSLAIKRKKKILNKKNALNPKKKHKKIELKDEKPIEIGDSKSADRLGSKNDHPKLNDYSKSSGDHPTTNLIDKIGRLDTIGVGAVNMYLIVFRDGIISV